MNYTIWKYGKCFQSLPHEHLQQSTAATTTQRWDRVVVCVYTRFKNIQPGRNDRVFYFRDVGESGRPLLPWEQEIAGSNPAIPTRREVSFESTTGLSPEDGVMAARSPCFFLLAQLASARDFGSRYSGSIPAEETILHNPSHPPTFKYYP